MTCGEGFCPRVNGKYLAGRFEEAIRESELGAILNQLPEVAGDQMVAALVSRLVIECGAEA